MFDRICAELNLGALTVPPQRLHGGYTHRMFRLDTTGGCYAVKLLNPEIMQRPGVLDNYRTAEGFEALLERENLPILPALTIGGRKLHCVDGQYLYVFDYFDGRVLTADEITPAHCAKIGGVLAGIHRAGENALPHLQTEVPGEGVLWRKRADALLASDDARAEGDLLQAAVPMLERASAAAENAVRRLPPMQALCHNDMDPKNVLWRGEDFRIIDLECLGVADPRQELLDLAVSWSGGEEGCFKAFVFAYDAAGSARLTDAALVYDSRRNYLDWLEYNARRALFDDPEERRIAREQIRWTLHKMEDDVRNREKILRWMEDISHG